MNKAILIQGSGAYLEQTYQHYSKFPQVKIMYSLWNGTSSPDPANTIWSAKPAHPGYGNSNLQFQGAYAGAQLAQEKGIDYLLKIRDDLLISNPNILMDNIRTDNILSVLSFHNWSGGYYVDYMIGLETAKMLAIMSEDTSDHRICSEQQLMRRYRIHSVSDTVSFLLPLMSKLNITCNSLKWNREIVSSMMADDLFVY